MERKELLVPERDMPFEGAIGLNLWNLVAWGLLCDEMSCHCNLWSRRVVPDTNHLFISDVIELISSAF